MVVPGQLFGAGSADGGTRLYPPPILGVLAGYGPALSLGRYCLYSVVLISIGVTVRTLQFLMEFRILQEWKGRVIRVEQCLWTTDYVEALGAWGMVVAPGFLAILQAS
jgi:hypothetical protein